jgi:hypothetical protein
MAFFIRKSFQAGPLRINLSKRGVGASIGVTGARIGLSSSGRAYAAGGRGGLYFRTSLSGSQTGRRSTAPTATRSEPVVIEADTGATFAPEKHHLASDATAELLGAHPDHHLLLVFAFPVVVLVGLAVFASGSNAASEPETLRTLAIALPVLALAWLLFAARQLRRVYRARAFGAALREALRGIQVSQEVPHLVAETRAEPADVAYQSRANYLAYLRDTLVDRRVADDEIARLELVERTFNLPESFVRGARVSAFRTVYLEAVSDHELESAERETLDHIRESLSIPEDELADELATVARLVEIRTIRKGALPVVDAGMRLQRDETCHHRGEGRLVKSKVLRSFQQDGQRHKIEGLVVEKKGVLLITNKRLLLVHDGTSSVRLDKILDIEVDLDQNLLSIVKDGAQKPALFTTPDAQRAGAVLAALARF